MIPSEKQSELEQRKKDFNTGLFHLMCLTFMLTYIFMWSENRAQLVITVNQ